MPGRLQGLAGVDALKETLRLCIISSESRSAGLSKAPTRGARPELTLRVNGSKQTQSTCKPAMLGVLESA